MSSPEELQVLISSFAEAFWGFRGMATSCDLELSVPEYATTERMTEKNFAEFLDVFLEGWNLRELSQSYEREFRGVLLPNTIKACYLTRYKGEPAGVSGTVFKENYGYLTSSVVLPRFRGLGLYKSLVQVRLIDLRARGFNHAVTQAREATSAPILERLGFATTFKGVVYKFAPGTRFK
jgi:GNAT superfamily N-acetyltransferase